MTHHPNASAIARYTSGILRARAAYNADQATPEDRAEATREARAEYERRRYEKRKEAT